MTANVYNKTATKDIVECEESCWRADDKYLAIDYQGYAVRVFSHYYA
jgi:hypothetical protein